VPAADLALGETRARPLGDDAALGWDGQLPAVTGGGGDVRAGRAQEVTEDGCHSRLDQVANGQEARSLCVISAGPQSEHK
jgi:hypothetical protein